MALIQIDHMTIAYRSNIAAKDVSFCIEEGDYLCIVGNNGSGKSSVIKAILGLVPVSEGSIKLNLKKEEIAYLPQDNSIQTDMPATVKEIVMTGVQKSGKRVPFYTKEDISLSDSAMEMMDIKHLTKKRMNQLSGGQKQRVLLARALCRQPKLLILDEPYASLDENAQNSLHHILLHLNKAHNVAIVMVSHDLADVKRYARHVLALNNKLTFFGDAADWNHRQRERV